MEVAKSLAEYGEDRSEVVGMNSFVEEMPARADFEQVAGDDSSTDDSSVANEEIIRTFLRDARSNGVETCIGDGGTEDEYSDEETREDGKDHDGHSEDQGGGELQGGGMDGGVDSQGGFGQGDVELQGRAELLGNVELLGGVIDGGV